jgi:hypothetical protein
MRLSDTVALDHAVAGDGSSRINSENNHRSAGLFDITVGGHSLHVVELFELLEKLHE